MTPEENYMCFGPNEPVVQPGNPAYLQKRTSRCPISVHITSMQQVAYNKGCHESDPGFLP